MTDRSPSTSIPDGFIPVERENWFIAHVGGIHLRRHEDRVETCAIVGRHQTNPIGGAHGGFLMTMFDITLGATAQSFIKHHGEGHPATIQLSSNFVGVARQGELVIGEAWVDTATRTLSFVHGRLHVAGRVIVTGSGVFRNPPDRSQPER